ncbi:MAG: bifunctional folylpolyglutamate synthase/dihydrofolate synthase [Thermoplasmatota archaeon]
MDPLEYLESLSESGMKIGLERMGPLLSDMGSPHLSMPSVMIAGTNGKGSTCKMASAILSRLGLRVITYTSPHLLRVNERVEINGQPVSDEILGAGIEAVRRSVERLYRDRIGPTYFETLTAAAFHIAKMKSADLLVSEVGLGGRLDATNVLDPQVCAITSISMDHTEILGDDPVSIAREKAGIIKPSVPVVIGPLCPDADDGGRCLRTILSICSQNGCSVVAISGSGEVERVRRLVMNSGVPDWRIIKVGEVGWHNGTSAHLSCEGPAERHLENPAFKLLDRIVDGEYTTPLVGKHHAWNMSCAIAVSMIVLPVALAHRKIMNGQLSSFDDLIHGGSDPVLGEYPLEVLRSAVSEGLSGVRMIGRFEERSLNGKEVILDGGHNEEAGTATAETIRARFPTAKASILISMMREKDPAAYMSAFGPVCSALFITRMKEERSMSVEKMLSGAVKGMEGSFPIHIRYEMNDAYDEWSKDVSASELGLACGSFYLYKEVHDKLPDDSTQ